MIKAQHKADLLLNKIGSQQSRGWQCTHFLEPKEITSWALGPLMLPVFSRACWSIILSHLCLRQPLFTALDGTGKGLKCGPVLLAQGHCKISTLEFKPRPNKGRKKKCRKVGFSIFSPGFVWLAEILQWKKIIIKKLMF